MSTEDRFESWSGREVVVYACEPPARERGVTGALSRYAGGIFQVDAPVGPVAVLRFSVDAVAMLRFPDDKDVDRSGRPLGPASDRWYAPEIWLRH